MKFLKIFLWLLAGICVLICIACLAIMQLTSEKEYAETWPETKGKTVTYLLVDGLSKRIFEQEIAHGNLPNIQTLINEGTYVQHGIGSLPSMTGYGFYPFLTGIDAAKSEILGLRWFDRSVQTGNLRNYVGRTNVQMNNDVTSSYKNVFEYYGGQYTASINTYMDRGSKHSEKTGWEMASAKYYDHLLFRFLRAIPYFGERITYNYFEHENRVAEMLKRQLERNPKVQWVTFTTPDASHHISGTTQTYVELIRHIDKLLGDVRTKVRELGQEKDRMIVLISDHGNSEVRYNLDLRVEFKRDLGLDLERGASTVLLSEELDTDLRAFAAKDGYFAINGNLSAYLYMKKPGERDAIKAWKYKLSYEELLNYPAANGTINIPRYIANIEGIELVSYVINENEIAVQTKDGMGFIKTDSIGRYSYRVRGADPLLYAEDSTIAGMMNGVFYSKDEWLAATYQGKYPDAIYRLYSLMSQPATGDVFICSLENYDLASEYEMFVGSYRGGHGGLRSEMLCVPYIYHIPRENQQKIPYARAEDIGVAVLDYLGMQVDYQLDGKLLD